MMMEPIVDITVAVHDHDDGGGSEEKVINTIQLVQTQLLSLLIKLSSSIYLEEDRSIVCTTASAGGDLDVVCSYEEIQ